MLNKINAINWVDHNYIETLTRDGIIGKKPHPYLKGYEILGLDLMIYHTIEVWHIVPINGPHPFLTSSLIFEPLKSFFERQNWFQLIKNHIDIV